VEIIGKLGRLTSKTMRKYYNKLIRDKIPQIIEHSGKSCQCQTLSSTEYLKALGEKLVEEAKETAIALDSPDCDALLYELADLYEVIDAILALKGIEVSQAIAKQGEKRQERGSFQKRLQLLWVDGDDER
jgi:predicted house-cleaning noncanonical NTP pyrophosphatase (MazG superfamily)